MYKRALYVCKTVKEHYMCVKELCMCVKETWMYVKEPCMCVKM